MTPEETRYRKIIRANRKREEAKKRTSGLWVVTIPKGDDIDQYLREVDEAIERDDVCFFRVGIIPNDLFPGQRLYVYHNGRIRGFQEITQVRRGRPEFICTTTGKIWPEGNYIGRGGALERIDVEVGLKGFQGVRRLESFIGADHPLVRRTLASRT